MQGCLGDSRCEKRLVKRVWGWTTHQKILLARSSSTLAARVQRNRHFLFRREWLDGERSTCLPRVAVLGLVLDVGNEGHVIK